MVLGVPSSATASTSDVQMEIAIQQLVHHPNLIRIKKLLIYVCWQTWESNLERIHAVDLQELIYTLKSIAPTLEHLQTQLVTAASSLNKAAEYRLVVDQILEQLRCFYERSSADVSPTQRTESVAQSLANHPQSLRIKKLLILVAHQQWMTDRRQLDAVNLVSLVEAMGQLANTIEELQQILTYRVKKLSKVAEYALVAEQIVIAFQEWYIQQSLELKRESSLETRLNSEATQYFPNTVSSTVSPTVSPLTTLSSKALPTLIESKIEPKTESKVKSDIHQSSIEAESIAAPRSRKIPKSANLSNLFDIRLELMRYANPFRVKILLFSLLHETFQHTTEQNLMIKNHELDDLLRLTLQTHSSMPSLTTRLLYIARSLDEPSEYTQIAQTFIRAVEPLYSQNSASPTAVFTAEPETSYLAPIATDGSATRPNGL